RFVYHAASQKRSEAADRVRTAARIARERAAEALRDLPSDTLLALPAAKKKLPELSRIILSHPLIHAAEGQLYRNAIMEAGRALGLVILTPTPKDPPRLGQMKAPWGKDQKMAAALAWAAIQEQTPSA